MNGQSDTAIFRHDRSPHVDHFGKPVQWFTVPCALTDYEAIYSLAQLTALPAHNPTGLLRGALQNHVNEIMERVAEEYTAKVLS